MSQPVVEHPPGQLARFLTVRVAAATGLAFATVMILYAVTGKLDDIDYGQIVLSLLGFAAVATVASWIRFRRRPLPTRWYR